MDERLNGGMTKRKQWIIQNELQVYEMNEKFLKMKYVIVAQYFLMLKSRVTLNSLFYKWYCIDR